MLYPPQCTAWSGFLLPPLLETEAASSEKRKTGTSITEHKVRFQADLIVRLWFVYNKLYYLYLLSSITAVNTSFSSVTEQCKHCSVCIFVVKCLFECFFFVCSEPVFAYCLLVTAKTNDKNL